MGWGERTGSRGATVVADVETHVVVALGAGVFFLLTLVWNRGTHMANWSI
jgi:hypothetical protein